MKKITLYINSDGERHEVQIENELSIGRTSQSNLALPDSGLSRVNTTFFVDGDEVFVVDENSTNGTFVNGEQIFSSPHKLKNRDEIDVGNNTQISIEITDKQSVSAPVTTSAEPKPSVTKTKPKSTAKKKKATPQNQVPLLPIVAGISTLTLIFIAIGAIILYKVWSDRASNKPIPIEKSANELIPKRVLDPLGREDPDDIEDLIAAWESEDKSVADNDLADVQSTISTSTTSGAKASELIVPIELFTKMLNLAKEPRMPSGERPPGLKVRPELCCGVPKQTKKLQQMVTQLGYKQPLDYAELADKKMKGDLIELPVATNIYVLDVGGNATEEEFNEFSWDTKGYTTKLTPDKPKYQILKRLADDFDGQKYDLNNPKHRKQMKIRLLRMFNKLAKPILMEFAGAYQQRFNRPLRITSLTRSMEYQISLNANNSNSFMVRGEGSLPPHTSGCAFDLARKQMTTEEQNFMIEKLAEMENRGILDALIEYNTNSCFHIFIYPDGKAPY